jgi:hypothetical protein
MSEGFGTLSLAILVNPFWTASYLRIDCVGLFAAPRAVLSFS